MISFKAHCARNHDRIDFTEPAAFEAHMGTEHGRKMSKGKGAAATRPYPWRAPKAPADASGLAAVLTEYADEVADAGTTGAALPGTEQTWRWDRGDEAPLHLLPTRLRGILSGAVARGERWGVTAKNGSVHVSVGRTPTEQAGFSMQGGRVYGVRVGRHTAAKITDVKKMFPAETAATKAA